MGGTTKLTGGWDTLEAALSHKKFRPIILKHMKRASMLNGLLAVKELKSNIKAGGFKANKALTEAIKGATKPLIGVDDGAQLYNSITYFVKGSWVFVGVQKTEGFYNIAKFIHEGGAINVTQKMRNMFKLLWLTSVGKSPVEKLKGRAKELWEDMPGNWMPLKQSTSVITVEGRPFFEVLSLNKDLNKKLQANWKAALRAAFRESVSKGGKK